MRKIKIVSDSTCDLSPELIEENDIEIVPLLVNFGEESYQDLKEISTQLMYQKVEEKGILPKTAAVPPGVFVDVFSKYLADGYQILYLGIGSKLSATFQSAMLAKNMIDSNEIYLIDSNNLSSGIGLLLLKASSLRSKGNDISTIVNKVEELVPKVRSQFVIDTLEYLHKGGRLSALGALAGKVLNIHPLIKVVDGTMVVGKKAFGNIRKGINIMLNEAIEIKDEIDDEFMMITHSIAPKSYNYINKKVNENFRIKNLYETHSGCVISSHCGKGTIGVLYIMK